MAPNDEIGRTFGIVHKLFDCGADSHTAPVCATHGGHGGPPSCLHGKTPCELASSNGNEALIRTIQRRVSRGRQRNAVSVSSVRRTQVSHSRRHLTACETPSQMDRRARDKGQRYSCNATRRHAINLFPERKPVRCRATTFGDGTAPGACTMRHLHGRIRKERQMEKSWRR